MLQDRALRALKHLDVPVLMIVAGKDGVVDNEVNKRAFRRIGSADKALVHIADLPHTDWSPEQEDDVYAKVRDWLSTRR